MSTTTALEPQVSQLTDSTVERFIQLAVAGLVPMFNPEQRLFCYRLVRTGNGLVPEGVSRRYTLITLMGLHRLEQAGGRSPIALAPALTGLLASLDWVDNIGDLGLLLWLCGLMAPERLEQIESQLPVVNALVHFADAKEARTMELAWFLTGLCYWAAARPESRAKLRPLAVETYERLIANQGSQGIFSHLSRTASIKGRLRGRIGSFADQVYPVYAFAKFSQVFSSDQAAQQALTCGRRLCEAQGPLGQWWWHYDSASGEMVEGYPVFSVHQHGMGPMVMFALGEATGHDFRPWISKGLNWINKRNELAVDMEHLSANIIWRCIAQPAWQRIWRSLRPRKHSHTEPQKNGLNVVFECRPYELGWLLYAFAGRVEFSRSPKELLP